MNNMKPIVKKITDQILNLLKEDLVLNLYLNNLTIILTEYVNEAKDRTIVIIAIKIDGLLELWILVKHIKMQCL